MEQHNFLQGTPEWHQHRSTHFNASDAPAMLGVSPYKTRSQLLDELATGIAPEADKGTQSRFADGHRFEALAQPLAEKIIGKKLYPVVGSEGKYSASFDGLTMDEAICFEHKSLNDSIRACNDAADLPEMYRIQMEQQLMVSGADKCIFMATTWDDDDSLIGNPVFFWYEMDGFLRKRIVNGWTQFEQDLIDHKPKITAEMPKAEVTIELPALFINAQGAITSSNMEEFGTALTAKLVEVRAIKLVTDQDFSNAKEAAKMFREQCKKLELAKEAMLAQTVTIGEAARMMDAWHEDLRVTALQLEKNVEKEDLIKKRAMVSEAGIAFTTHIEALEAETRPIQLNIQRPDFATAIKGKRNYTSMQDAIDTLLANTKIEADFVAKQIRQKLEWFNSIDVTFIGLFPDLQTIIHKADDDFMLTVNSRIDQHKKAQAERIEAERARIQAEEKAKAESAAQADVAKQVKAQLEAEIKARDEQSKPAQEFKFEVLPASPDENPEAINAQPIVGPSRKKLISVIAFEYGVELSLAENWLQEAFATVAA